MTKQQAPSESDWEKGCKQFAKDHIIPSEPSDYIHHGLNPACQFSSLIEFISKVRAEAVLEALEKVVPSWLNNKEAVIVSFGKYYWRGYLNAGEEVLRRVAEIKKELTDPK